MNRRDLRARGFNKHVQRLDIWPGVKIATLPGVRVVETIRRERESPKLYTGAMSRAINKWVQELRAAGLTLPPLGDWANGTTSSTQGDADTRGA